MESMEGIQPLSLEDGNSRCCPPADAPSMGWRQLRNGRTLRPLLLFFLLPFAGTAWLGRKDREEVSESSMPLDVDFVELEVPGPAGRFQVSKLYVPLAPEIVRWMNTSDLKFSISIDTTLLTQLPRIHVLAKGEPLRIGNLTSDEGIHTILELPENVDARACKVAVIVALADVGNGEATPTKALLLICQVQQSARESLQNSSRLLLEKGHPLRWLLVPWVLLLLPLIVGSAMGPMALLGGAALTLASIACLSFLIAIVIVIVQRRCLHCTRRWRRLYRLLERSAVHELR
ncbi:unnamed protein product [Durusdinium trenchii]|uniref:Uncharacterized protein n=1 Tax=Durusdinium trenchii TaxID=1381693 RepID=A0ABP0HF18_9DINO